MRAIPASSSCASTFLRASVLVVVILCAAMVAIPAVGQEPTPAAVARPLITQPVNEAQLTTLKGNVHPLAKPQFDLGSAPASLPMQRMMLVLKRSPEQETALRKLLDDQQDKGSPNYHKWLTPEQYGKQFGPSDADMQAIASWLQSHGFQVGTTKGRTVLEFSGSASQVREAFHTSIHKYAVNGEQHWANASDPQIPTALTPAVAGIATLHNFLKKPQVLLAEKYIPAKLTSKSRPEFTGSTGMHALTPDDYRTIYNWAPAEVSGLGSTIAVVGRSNLFNQGQDVNDFRSVLGIGGGGTGLTIVLDGPDPGDLGGNEELEATLDSSWSGALAPSANIDFVVSGSTNSTDGIDLSELYIIENNLGGVMTESFGTCESGVTSAQALGISTLAEQAAAQGITYIVSTGDTGAEGCDNLGETTAVGGVSVNVLASTPFTVALGGTEFNEIGGAATYWGTNNTSLGSALSYIPENAWNETCMTACQSGQPPLAAGSGGASTLFSKPSWQTGVNGTRTDSVRDIPDVSLSAAGHDFYLLCIEGSCVPSGSFISFAGVEGTSAAAPSFAGIMALVDQMQGARQGQASYILYQLATQQQTAGTSCNASVQTLPNRACVFNDVTVGNISVPGEAGYPNGLYSAAAGYDLATGLGSVNVANLINAWSTANFNASSTTLHLTPVSITHGASVSVSATVTGNSGTPSGQVALIATTASGTFGLLSTQPLSLANGLATGLTTALPGGTYTVSAHYEGDGTFAPSDSSPISVTVNKESSTTTLSNIGPGGPLANGTTLPFGSVVFVRADVTGQSGQGIPTGSVTFSDSFGPIPTLNPQIVPPVAVINPVPLNSQGNTSIGDGIISFDAGNHTILASYGGDPSFGQSSSPAGSPVTFTIQPGFAEVSGPTDVTVTSPGMSGTSTAGIIASTGFSTAISFTCTAPSGSEIICSPASATGQGPNTIVSTNITVNTTAPHTVSLQPNERPYYFAAIVGGGLPLAGIFLLAAPRRCRWSTLLGFMTLALLVTLPACGGGGGGGGNHQDPGTPIGTYTVTVTAAATTTTGSLSMQGSFNLTVK